MRQKNRRNKSNHRRLVIESLESRKVLAVAIVKDLNDNNAAQAPGQMTTVGALTFFTMLDQNGEELWKTDGTPGGTSLVKDIYVGASSSSPQNLTNVNGTLYFVATTQSEGRELWKSDGTAAGTQIVKDIVPGSAGSYVTDLTNVNGTLYFTAANNVGAYPLWKSDGTDAGTSAFHNFASLDKPSSFVALGSKMYFLQVTAANGQELWVTDGTSAGTSLVRDIRPGTSSSSIREMTASGSRLYFVANNGTNGNEVWRSEGTLATTVILRDLETGAASSDPAYLTDVNGTLMFAATNSAQGGRELYKSAPSTASRVKDINAGPGGSSPQNLVNVSGTLYFSAASAGAGPELWKSDGTDSGTVSIELEPGSAGIYPRDLTNVGGTVYFSKFDHTSGSYDLWKSNGTLAGTSLVKDLDTVVPGGQVQSRTAVADKFLFTLSGSGQIWASIGTSAGTIPVTNNVRTNSSYPNLLSAANNKLAFTILVTPDLYFSDGTELGTTSVTIPGGFLANVTPAYMGSFFYFSAYEPNTGYELWRSDGTVAGTTLVKDIRPGTGYGSPDALTVVGNKLFFVADNGVLGRELWVSDGTTGGTQLVKNIRAGSPSSSPQSLTNVNGTLFFTADSSTGSNDRELYKSDGTEAGTGKVLDISTTGSSFPGELTELDGKVYFAASNSAGDRELWASDGTAAGTSLVKNIATNFGSNPSELTRVGSQIFFSARADIEAALPDVGLELWKTDGTTGGTVLVANIEATNGYSSYPTALTAVGNKLFFTAYSENNSKNALWVSDGTAAGTTLVADLAPDTNENFSGLTEFSGKLIFSANDTVHGQELWMSDGTPSGTVLLKDLWNSGTASSDPSRLTVVQDQLFFAANDGRLGVELWKFTFPIVASSANSVTAVEGSTATNSGSLKYSSSISASYGTVTNNGNGTWSWSGAASDGPATIPVTITVTDIDGLTATSSFDVVVTNAPPVVGANSATVSANEGSVATNSGTYSDPGVDTVTLSASIGTIVDNGNGTWSWSLTTTDGNATDTVTITATDSDGASSTISFSLQTLNVAPSVAANSATVTVDEGSTATMGGTASDPGVDTITLSASFGTIVDNGDGTWSWSAATSDGPDDSQTVTITATDSDGSSSSTTFQLIVNNVAPVVVANSASVTVDEGSTANNTGTVSDIGGDSVALSASFGTVVNNGDGTWSWSAATNDGPDQSQTVTITATDSDGAISSTTFDLQVTNVAPSVSANTATVTGDEGTTVTNAGTYSDVGLDTVSLTASFGDIVNNGDGTWSWSAATNDGPDQSQVITITATDSDGASSTTTFDLQVTNVAPTIAVNAATVSATEGSQATNSGTFADVGLDTVTLSASYGTVVDNGDGTWSWSVTPADGPDDSQTVTVTATDSDGATVSTSFTLTVDNAAPTIAATNATVVVNQAATASNSGTYSDAGVDGVTLSLSPVDFGTLVDNGNGTWGWSYYNIALLAAPVNVTVTATDSDGASSSVTFVAQPGSCSTQVLNTLDSGDGSLRAALSCSNSLVGVQTVSFAVPGAGPQTIDALSALPFVTDTVIIDGTTQPGYAGSPLIYINGLAVLATSTDGLRIQAANSSVLGLAVGNFTGDGIEVSGANGVTIRNNYVGLTASGLAAGNKSVGLRINNASNATIDGNVISRNVSAGVIISGASSTANLVKNNRVGTNPAGTVALGNGSGVLVQSAGNIIGQPGAGNIISGNTGTGLSISVATATNNTVQGNRIGTKLDGNSGLPNGTYGVLIRSQGNQIGGDQSLGQGNLISGNRSHGLVLSGGNSNFIEGNFIGTNLLGDAAVPNGAFGVYLAGAANNFMGSLAPGKGNVISGNAQTGMIVSGPTSVGNLIQGNYIGTSADGMSDLGNGGNGINLRASARSNQIVRNVTSGNSAAGIAITEATTQLNTLKGNLIGVDKLGSSVIPNGTFGILIRAKNNVIGGLGANDGNLITGSTRGIAISDATATNNTILGNTIGGPAFPPMSTGIFISTGATNNTIGPANTIAYNVTGIRSSTGGNGNRITENLIYSNSTIGIDLGGTGPTSNDVGDADVGANQLQNWPQLQSPVNRLGNDLGITYLVSSLPANATFPLTIEFFKDNGVGQGSVFLGSDIYTEADRLAVNKAIVLFGAGALAFNGDFVTATATDLNGNTSEFSASVLIGFPLNLNLSNSMAGARSPMDVKSDGEITPLDVLQVITYLQYPSQTSSGESSIGRVRGDVNGDNQVTPLDALLIIDWLNKRTTAEPSVIASNIVGEDFGLDDTSLPAEGESQLTSPVDQFFAELDESLQKLKKQRV